MISRRKPPVTTSGRAGAKGWILRFERRRPQTIEPLMGWTADDDPLMQVEMTFETREQAIAYADREGLACRIEGERVVPRESEADPAAPAAFVVSYVRDDRRLAA